MTYQRDFDRKLNVALVGAGSHAYRNLLPAMHHLPVRLQAVCDVNPARSTSTAEQYGCRHYESTADLYAKEELDAVFLSVGPAQHPGLAREAFDAGVHVWLEKPPAMRADQVREMIRHRKDRVAVVGVKKVFMPAARKAMEILAAPDSGPLRSLLAVYPMTIPPNGREVLEKGLFTDWLGNGIHPLSLMIAVGGPVRQVTVLRGKFDGGVCVLEFESGAIGNFHMAAGAPGSQPMEYYAFYAKKCSVVIENCRRVVYQRGIPFQYGKTASFAPEGFDHGALVWEPQNTLATLENKALFTQGIYGEMKHFCDCVLEGKPASQGTLEFALEVMKVYEAALLSDGKPISVPRE